MWAGRRLQRRPSRYFSSRLNLNLREDKGYTYGARSTFEWRVHPPGPFIATAAVKTLVTAPLAEFLKELDGMVGRRPVTTAELEFCRKFITRGYPASFETPTQLAAQLETLFVYGLPDISSRPWSGNQRRHRRRRAGDGPEVFKTGELTIVVVGDRKKIEADLRKLPLGKDLKVYQFDDDFRLVPAK